MGYTTTFENGFIFDKPVSIELYKKVNEFSKERHEPGNGVPGYYCQWVINNFGELVWDGGEKFYSYVEWLEYLIDNFFKPDGYVLNGEVEYQGEDPEDFGTIEVVDNVIIQHFGIHALDLTGISTDDLIKELKRRGYLLT